MYCIYFISEYSSPINDLRTVFYKLHAFFCKKYGYPYAPKDFDEAIKILEGGFISINGSDISFINPSIRDYLAEYLLDKDMLNDFAEVIPTARWAIILCKQFHNLETTSKDDISVFYSKLIPFAQRLNQISIVKTTSYTSRFNHDHDIGHTRRISMLVTWWQKSGFADFLSGAVEIATHPIHGYSTWDGLDDLAEILVDLERNERENSATSQLRNALESLLVRLLQDDMLPDDLDLVSEIIIANTDVLPPIIVQVLQEGIKLLVGNMPSIVASEDSESTLEDYRESIENLCEYITIPNERVQLAIDIIDERIDYVQAEASEACEATFTGKRPDEDKRFDDNDIDNLFTPLLS